MPALTESVKLYETLQQSVDQQIQTTGFVPPHGYGMENGGGSKNNGNGHASNGHSSNGNGNGSPGISEKQLDLINKIVKDNNANKNDIENLSVEPPGTYVDALEFSTLTKSNIQYSTVVLPSGEAQHIPTSGIQAIVNYPPANVEAGTTEEADAAIKQIHDLQVKFQQPQCKRRLDHE